MKLKLRSLSLFLAALCFCAALSACSNPAEPEGEAPQESEARAFAVSEEAAESVKNLVGKSCESAEICALYKDIATFKVVSQNFTGFLTFKIKSGETYSLSLLSERPAEGEFFPTEADGYPAEALKALKYREVGSSEFEKLSRPEKLFFDAIQVGSGQKFTNAKHIKLLTDIAETAEVLPVERFFTENEKLAGLDMPEYALEYYAFADDDVPLYVLNFSPFLFKASGQDERSYYINNSSAFLDELRKTYFGILEDIRSSGNHP